MDAAPKLIAMGSGLLVGGVVDTLIPKSQVDAGLLSPDKLIASGAAGLVMLTMWLWMKRDEKREALHAAAAKDERETHAATIRTMAEEFSETATNISRNFAETTKGIDERASTREQKLHELLQRRIHDRRQDDNP